MRKLIVATVLLLLFVSSCTTEKKDAVKAPKYVFYFIGDGYGPAQAQLAEAYLAHKKGQIAPDTLLMNTFPAQGTYTTHAENRYITGSAAAGTALASGYKTSINTICMSGDHSKNYKSLAEQLYAKGMKVGIITSVSIDHATPAVFYAHQPKRNMYYDIALELPKSGFNYFAGGGFKDPEGKRRKEQENVLANMGIDGKSKKKAKKADTKLPNVYDVAKKAGYRFVNTKAEFNQLKPGDDKIVVFEPEPAGGASIPYVIDQTDKDFTLIDYTRKGIELLDNPNGFFMMIEGGKIDWACHANDVATAVHEVLQFDDAVKVAYEFYKKHPEETLIVICSDHETGGLTLGYALTHYKSYYQYLDAQTCSNEIVSKEMAKFKQQRTPFKKIYPYLKKWYGFDSSKELKLNKYELADLKKALSDYYNNIHNTEAENPMIECAYGPYNPVATVAARILAHKAGLGWTTYSHTALPCPARAIGVGADAFYGYYDNTELPQKIMKMYGLTPSK